jgi:hypothetical protein
MHKHDNAKGDIFTTVVIASYSIVLAVAWWMIFRDKPRLQKWAIAANGIFVFMYLPVIFINWRAFLKAELEMWPIILFGILGMVLFCIPYRPKISDAPSGCDGGIHTASVPGRPDANIHIEHRGVKRFAALLLAICRTVYCWAFLITSIATIYHTVGLIAESIHAHEEISGYISTVILFISYSIVSGIAWWKIFRNKPMANHWAITASVMVFFIYVLTVFAGWRAILTLMHYMWPEILFGILGVIIFSIPYRPRISGAPHSCGEDIHPDSTPGSTVADF